MGFTQKQKELMIKLSSQKQPVQLIVYVSKYRHYTREFGSGCNIYIKEVDPVTGERWDAHYFGCSGNRDLAIDRAKSIATFLTDSGAINVKCQAERE